MTAPAGLRRLQELIGQVDALADPEARALAEDLLRSVLEVHGEGLRRMLELTRRDRAGEAIEARFLEDPAVRTLLLVHDLHPLPLEQRLKQALDKVLPYIRSHGGDLELLGFAGGDARLRLSGTCKSCPSSTATIELAIRAAIEEFCPDLTGFEVEGAEAYVPGHTG